jgi:hypothetical protein
LAFQPFLIGCFSSENPQRRFFWPPKEVSLIPPVPQN